MSPAARYRSRNPAWAAVRAVAFFLWSLFIIALWLVRRLPVPLAARPSVAAHYTGLWSRGVLRLLGIRVKVKGAPPREPFFLVANHLGYLDIAVIASQAPATFVAKAQVSGWPLFGSLAGLAGTLFVDRSSTRDTGRLNSRIAAHLLSGGSLALFPEGTSTDGSGMAPFRSPLFQTPAAQTLPVYAAALRYRSPAGAPRPREALHWWGDMEFLPHFLALFRLRGAEAEIQFAPKPVICGDRKVLAETLEGAVKAMLGLGNANATWEILEAVEMSPSVGSMV